MQENYFVAKSPTSPNTVMFLPSFYTVPFVFVPVRINQPVGLFAYVAVIGLPIMPEHIMF
jgi:hypothetical protein